jgi:adenosylmethionine-8-amino-7-oxononanoate aminotransferase
LLDNNDINAVWHCFTQMQEYLKNKPLVIKKSQGKYLYDEKNNAIYDGVSSLLNASFGHNNPQIIAAIKDQLDTLDNNSLFLTTNEPSVRLANKLIELTSGDFKHVFFANSGSESVETALKIARKYKFRKTGVNNGKIIAFENSYHGSTLCATLLSGNEHDLQGISFDAGFMQIPTLDVNDYTVSVIEKKVDEYINNLRAIFEKNNDVSAVITEIIQLSNGAMVIPKLYFQKLRALCDEFDVLWIADEVATGFGRTGSIFAYQALEVEPDILLLGKAISGGHIPLGAVCVRPQIYNAFLGNVSEGNELSHGFTTSGHPLACSAALATIDFLEQNALSSNAKDKGKRLKESLSELCAKFDYVMKVSGEGLLLSLIFQPNVKVPIMGEWGIAHLVSKRLVSYGLLLYPDGEDSLIIAPPLTISDEDIDFITSTLSEVLMLFGRVIQYEKV